MPAPDYSALSNEDIQFLRAKEYNNLSDEAILILKGKPPATPEAPSVSSDVQPAMESVKEAEFNKELVEMGLLGEEDISGAMIQRDWREQLGMDLEDILLMGGAMGGAELAATAAAAIPHPYAKVGAGLLGGAAGAFGAQFIADTIKGRSFPDTFLSAWEAGKEDALYSAGGFAAVQLLGSLGSGVAKVLGVDLEKAQRLLKMTGKYGGDVGILDVTRFSPVRGYKQVVGLFPFVGTPIRRSGRATQEAVVSGIERRLDYLAPNASLSSLGLDLVTAAENSYKEFSGVASRMYEHADTVAERSGVVVPVIDLRKSAEELLPRMDLPATKPGTKPIPEGEPANQTTSMRDFIIGITNIADDYIPVSQLRNLQKRINEIYDAGADSLTNTDKARLYKLKLATETALADATHPTDPAIADQVRSLYGDANVFYTENMRRFSSPTAQKFERVNRNIFRSGGELPGNLTADRIVDAALDLRSPQAITDLQAIVGEDLVAATVREHLERNLEHSIDRSGEVISFNFSHMLSSLGEGTGKNVSKAAIATALAPKGVDVEDFIDLLNLAEAKGRIPLANQFVARRAVMGGSSSALRALTGMGLAAGTVGVGAVPSVLSFGMARAGAEILQSQKFLKALVNAKNPKIDAALRLAHLQRAMDAIFESAPITQQEKIEAARDEYDRVKPPKTQ